MGGKRVRACAGPALHSNEKNFFETIFNKKIVSAKSEGVLSEVVLFEIRNVWNSAKKQKSLILFKLESVSYEI